MDDSATRNTFKIYIGNVQGVLNYSIRTKVALFKKIIL